MNYTTEITIQGDQFTVEWVSHSDTLIPDNISIFDCAIVKCPEDMLKKYGDVAILYECNRVEEEIVEEKKIERKIDI